MLHGDAAGLFHGSDAGGEHRARHHVFRNRHRRERLHDLEGAGDAARRYLKRLEVLDRFALVQDFAGARRKDAGDDVDQRTLAGAVRADQSDDLSRFECERDIVDGADAAEGAADIPELEQCGHAEAALRQYLRGSNEARPEGRNRISTTMRKPSTPVWSWRKLRQTNSSRARKATAPIAGPNTVPMPPSR